MSEKFGRRMTVMEGAKVVELLTKHFDKDKVEYLNNWDDGRIAEAVGVPLSSVANVRKNHFGHLINPKATPAISREEFETLQQSVALLQAMFYDLCSALGHTPRVPL